MVGGFLLGTVNVMLPAILIYLSALGVAPLVMTQVMNACFLVGKVSQAVVFALHGRVDAHGLLLTLPVCFVGYAEYIAGALAARARVAACLPQDDPRDPLVAIRKRLQ